MCGVSVGTVAQTPRKTEWENVLLCFLVIPIRFSRIKYGENRPIDFPLGRRHFLSWPVYVRVDREDLMKQCLYFLCIFLCSKKSSNVFSCWVQRRDCPGKSELLWKGNRDTKAFVPEPHLVQLSAEFPEPGRALRLRWLLMKAIYMQRMCAQAGSHKINEVEGKQEKRESNITKKHLHGRANIHFLCLMSV